MRWRRLRADKIEETQNFLLAREECCIAACERFLNWNEGPDRIWEAHERLGAIKSVLMLSATGILLPVLSSPTDEYNRTGMQRSLALHRIRSVQGLADDVLQAEGALASLGLVDPERISYTLMKLDALPTEPALASGPAELLVRQATKDDADAIFPLQAAYEIEEVVPSRSSFRVAASRLALERTLALRKMLVAELDGKIVGKANTNARSFTRDQIGGVYVAPEYRGRGIATRLVAELCRQLREEGRGISLFVKERNLAAQKAYARVGFESHASYRISYYN